jgi:hypothetical protein
MYDGPEVALKFSAHANFAPGIHSTLPLVRVGAGKPLPSLSIFHMFDYRHLVSVSISSAWFLRTRRN